VETYPGQVWPVQVQRVLRGLVHEANLARAAGLRAVPAERRDPLIAEFRGAVRVGLATVAPAERGTKQPVGRRLLACLRDRHDDVLRFVVDLDVWPTNDLVPHCTSWRRWGVRVPGWRSGRGGDLIVAGGSDGFRAGGRVGVVAAA
jgi:hypothetical protein